MKIALSFFLKQVNACMFGVFLLCLIVLSKFYYPFGSDLLDGIERYDFMLLCSVVFQIGLLVFKFESVKEFTVIILFHALAMVMEIFKVKVGSWIYPEPAQIAVFGVPLFAGFMYSAVGSYIARSQRLFQVRFVGYPKFWLTVVLVILIYCNFFTHHYMWDMRWPLTAFSILLFLNTRLRFKVSERHFQVPLLPVFFCVAVLIWFAENIATYSNVWLYPNQAHEWQMVSLAKVSSWYLLMLLSFVLVQLIADKPSGQA